MCLLTRHGYLAAKAVLDAIAPADGFKGVTGPIRFDENGDPIKPMTLNRLKFGGVLYLKLVSP